MRIENGLLYGADDAVAELVRRRIGHLAHIREFGHHVGIGIVRNDKIIGGAVFNNWRHPDIHINFAADPGWASRRVIRGIIAYPFKQLGCWRITAITEEGNTPTRAFLERFGFVLEGRHPFLFPDGVMAISYGLYRTSCIWLEEKTPGKVCPAASRAA